MKWTKVGKISAMYYKQKASSKRRGHPMPAYTKEELIAWCLGQPLFRKLYRAWRQSGWDKPLAPSCDRIDDSKPYTFENLQLMTWRENNSKGVSGRLSKRVGQYSAKRGTLVNEFKSMNEAERVTGIDHSDISKCCRGVYKKVGGFKWKLIK